MDNVPLRAGAFVTGGLLIGVWLFVVAFGAPVDAKVNVGQWTLWGLVGFAISAGLLGGRLASLPLRVGAWVAVGIAIGMLIMAAVFREMGEALAGVFTASGGILIVSALPGMQPTAGMVPPTNLDYETDPAEAPARRPRKRAE